jgi:hypothetical protein
MKALIFIFCSSLLLSCGVKKETKTTSVSEFNLPKLEFRQVELQGYKCEISSEGNIKEYFVRISEQNRISIQEFIKTENTKITYMLQSNFAHINDISLITYQLDKGTDFELHGRGLALRSKKDEKIISTSIKIKIHYDSEKLFLSGSINLINKVKINESSFEDQEIKDWSQIKNCLPITAKTFI